MRIPAVPPLALAAAALLLTACAGASATPPGPATPSGPVVTGRTYLSTSVSGDRTRPLVAGTRIQLRFTGDALGVRAGCNSIGGTVTRTGDRLTLPDGLTSTAMGCSPELLAQDRWVMDVLTAGVTLGGNSDRPTISGPGATIAFEPAPATS